MAYRNHEFCWHGIISTDVDRAKAFYSEVLGWGVQSVQMGDDMATMFTVADIPRCHLMAPPMEGVPSHWSNYLRVSSVDDTTSAAAANGGQMQVPPTDIPPGRFSVVTSPSGAMLSLFRESDDSARNAPGGEGAIHWTELHSKDIDADLAWLKATFGFTTEEMEMPDGMYYVLKNSDGEMAGGAMASQNPQAPAMWLTWVEVADVDACVDRIKNHGGNLLSPMIDVPNVGRMSVAQDPTGGVFGVITPAPKA